MLTESTVFPNGLTEIYEGEGDDGNGETQESNESATPVDSKPVEHGLGREREKSTHGAATAARCGLSTGRKGFVRIRQIIQHGHKDQHVPQAKDDAGQHRNDPGDIGR